MIDVMPDSRARSTVGAKLGNDGRWWVPVYCANCGKAKGGYIPEENMTFVFWLCDPCFERYGEIAGTMAAPDEVVDGQTT